ncbi:ABC transporter permease [Paraburkholderia bonniea]|uniref:ABC transporter permease n=1 Tax=Paraburkholderia bonniea TaxID=2152891 RepID=UPI001292B7FE|nr:ABC transporter permease [Paraburkholderia bonniea]WJF91809.1 ABC transporter permease [Paraburkholderia bonniea]WJF95128.1 ABC transporter permease [Paraburkholderia bonniea]
MIQRPVRLFAGLAAIGIAATLLVRAINSDALSQYKPDLLYYTGQHLLLVGYSMGLALLVGIPAGVLLSRPAFARQAERFMQVFNIGNTIPSLAVLAIALGIFGIGELPAIAALFLASLLPVTRNAYEGMKNVSPALREAARGIGMTGWQSLIRVELPNALPIIVGGVRTALSINVGTAPLAYLIGADSLGTFIFPGIYLNNPQQLLLGAGMTALLALVLDGLVASGSRYFLARRGVTA